MSNPLITKEQYYSYTNTVSGTNDTLVDALISAVSDAIELYCDRNFWQDTYIQWLNWSGDIHWCPSFASCRNNVIYPKTIPIRSIVYFGEVDTALTITNKNTVPYTVSIQNEKIIVTSNLTSTEYSLNNTLTNIVSVLSANYLMDIDISADVTDNGLLLKPYTYTILANESKDIEGAAQVEGNATIDGNKIYNIGNCDVLVYIAGYSTIPIELQLITSNIVRDALGIQLETIKRAMKSETITNYSYTIDSNINWYNLISVYSGQLAFYKNVSF